MHQISTPVLSSCSSPSLTPSPLPPTISLFSLCLLEFEEFNSLILTIRPDFLSYPFHTLGDILLIWDNHGRNIMGWRKMYHYQRKIYWRILKIVVCIHLPLHMNNSLSITKYFYISFYPLKNLDREIVNICRQK